MEREVFAIDIDGTLRCNCTPTCRDGNRRIVDLVFVLLESFKNVRVMIWSGGGTEYARQFGEKFFSRYPERKLIYASKLDQSTWKWGRPTITVDDIQDTALGSKANLIVKMEQ